MFFPQSRTFLQVNATPMEQTEFCYITNNDDVLDASVLDVPSSRRNLLSKLDGQIPKKAFTKVAETAREFYNNCAPDISKKTAGETGVTDRDQSLAQDILDGIMNGMRAAIVAQDCEAVSEHIQLLKRFIPRNFEPINTEIEPIEENWVDLDESDIEDAKANVPSIAINEGKKIIKTIDMFGYAVPVEIVEKLTGYEVPVDTCQEWWDRIYATRAYMGFV